MKAYKIRITLKDSNPLIWREFWIPEKVSFKRLHDTIQFAMGWHDYHLHEFSFEKENLFISNNLEEIEETEYYKSIGKTPRAEVKDSSKVKIDRYIKKYPKFSYVYDFGDYWEHEVEFISELSEYPMVFPVLVGGEGNCPPEDCGGIGGYERFLEITGNPKDPECKEMKAWAKGNGYKKFDFRKTDEMMREFLRFKRVVR